MLKMHTSSGACASASPRNEVMSSSLRASSERATMCPPCASISAASGVNFSRLRRPAKTVKPSAANFRAIAAPIWSPAPITAAVAFLICKDDASDSALDRIDYERHQYHKAPRAINHLGAAIGEIMSDPVRASVNRACVVVGVGEGLGAALARRFA